MVELGTCSGTMEKRRRRSRRERAAERRKLLFGHERVVTAEISHDGLSPARDGVRRRARGAARLGRPRDVLIGRRHSRIVVIVDLTADPAASVGRKFELQVKTRRKMNLQMRARLGLRKLKTKKSPRSRKPSLRLLRLEKTRSRRVSCARFPGV